MQKARSAEATRELPSRAVHPQWFFNLRRSLADCLLISLSQCVRQTQNGTDSDSAKKEYDRSAQTEKVG
jgi:hypothetical protein